MTESLLGVLTSRRDTVLLQCTVFYLRVLLYESNVVTVLQTYCTRSTYLSINVFKRGNAW